MILQVVGAVAALVIVGGFALCAGLLVAMGESEDRYTRGVNGERWKRPK